MTVLHQIAYFQQRRDELPNQELARDLVERHDHDGIREIAENLANDNPQIQSDCLKVLYEIGYRKPELIRAYALAFVDLLRSRNNRLVWGGMIALSTIAGIAQDMLFAHVEGIQRAVERGSVITVDNGIKTLARIAAGNATYNQAIFPYLLRHLNTCRAQELPQHAESIAVAVNMGNQHAFIAAIEQRLAGMPTARAARLRKVIKAMEQR
jgi:hypothetical protein